MAGDLATPTFTEKKDAHNAYVRMLDEYYDNPELSNDDSWLMQHDESRCAVYGEW
jgi:hypothetical protein